jgi:L-aminopeptidase/D-esterase-like protein
MKEIGLTEIDGIRVGHAQDRRGGTGCTVVLCEKGATAGVDVRGGAPASRETQLLNPVNLVEQIHAVLLTGGSGFGLDAAGGVMAWLEERGIGFDVQVTKVPIVCASALFDLVVGDHRARPDKAMGYEVCGNATTGHCPEGNWGAGTGASVGKILGMARAMKGGLGVYGLQVGEVQIASLVAVNCLGDVVHPVTGERMAGLLDGEGTRVAHTEEVLYAQSMVPQNLFSGNTTLGVVVTNGRFSKAQATKIASMTHNGFARSMRPSHTMFDGDTIYCLATGAVEADINAVGALAAQTMAQAVCRAVLSAEGAYGLKACRDL